MNRHVVKKLRKLLCILASLALLAVPLSLVPAGRAAHADGPTVITSNTQVWSGEMVVEDDVTINGTIHLAGNTTITVDAGKTLNLKDVMALDVLELTIKGAGTVTADNIGGSVYVEGGRVDVRHETTYVCLRGGALRTRSIERDLVMDDGYSYKMGGAQYSPDGFNVLNNSSKIGEWIEPLFHVENATNESLHYISTLDEAFSATPSDPEKPVTVKLLSDVEITEGLVKDSDTDVILDLNDHYIRYKGSTGDFLTLEGGSFTLTDTAEVKTKRYVTLQNGRAVSVSDSGTPGTNCLEVTGGFLAGGVETAVFVGTGVTFNMAGGTICGNFGDGCSTLVFGPGSSFEMTGGSISGNYPSEALLWFGVDDAFEMTGGSISGNNADADLFDFGPGSSFEMTGGSISGNYSGEDLLWFYVDDAFKMTGGSICDNTVGDGGKLFCFDPETTFEMTGGSICDNTVGDGGMLFCFSPENTFEMTGGSICDNIVEEGGVLMDVQPDTALNMSGTPVIKGNTENIVFTSNRPINVTGPLGSGAEIHVYVNKTGVIARPDGISRTTDLSENEASCFVNDYESLTPVLYSGKVIIPKPLTDSEITVSGIAGQTYSGSAITPDVTVKDGNTTLVKDRDYTVSYSNNVNAADKGATVAPTVTITGMGGYSRSISKKFSIEPKEVGLNWANTNLTYNGEDQKPTASVKPASLIGEDTCTVTTVEGAQTNVGTYTATATRLSNSNYKLPDEATTQFTIGKADIPTTAIHAPVGITDLTYNGSEQALVRSGSVDGNIGTIMYYGAKYTGSNTTPDRSLFSATIPKGKNADHYRVAYYVKGDANHNDGTPVVLGTLEIGQSSAAPNGLKSAYTVPYLTDTVGETTFLPDGWDFDDADLDTELSVGEAVTVTVTYDGTDKDNYVDAALTQQITITRSACTHPKTEVRDKVVPTSDREGYSGDTYCTVCGALVKKGDVEAKTFKPVTVNYVTHIQNVGWEKTAKKNGETSGTTGSSLRLEGIRIKVTGNENLGIRYTTHCQDYGWLAWSRDGEMSGTEGESKRLEAIMINLTGADKDKYDVYYRVHAQNVGWMNWAKNGEAAGTAGYGYRLEALQIEVVKKGEKPVNVGKITTNSTKNYEDKNKQAAPKVDGSEVPNVSYRTHVQNVGWQAWKVNGGFAGTSGRSLRLEGINIKLTNKDHTGGIRYKTHIQNLGWEKSWRTDGEMSGTSGRSLRLEAIDLELYGDMAEYYDIYYRVHAQDVGWMGWAANGADAGTAGYARRLEGIQVVLVAKGAAAPAANYGGITSVTAKPFLQR